MLTEEEEEPRGGWLSLSPLAIDSVEPHIHAAALGVITGDDVIAHQLERDPTFFFIEDKFITLR